MAKLASFLVFFVGLQHLAFAVLEMFFWNHPVGQKIFRLTPEFAAQSQALAANQGLYNSFLAAGLLISLFFPAPSAFHFRVFFLGCVTVAGVFGALTVAPMIFFVQALPAILALIAIFL